MFGEIYLEGPFPNSQVRSNISIRVLNWDQGIFIFQAWRWKLSYVSPPKSYNKPQETCTSPIRNIMTI